MESGRPQIEPEEWEIEAGLELATDDSGQESFSIDIRTEASGKAVTSAGNIADEINSAATPAVHADPDIAVQSSHGHRCLNCGAPVDRVRRRTRDRLVSLVIPVCRYRCSMKGWSCDWEGVLRNHYW